MYNYAKGVGFVMLMCLIGVLNNIFTKLMGSRLHEFEISFFRFFFSLVSIVVFIAYRGQTSVFYTKNLGLHIVRSLLGFFAIASMSYAIIVMKLVNIVSIEITHPIFILLLAFLFTKEKIDYKRSLASVLSFLSILLSVGVDLFSAATLLGIFAMILFAAQDILIKSMIALDSSITMLFYFSLFTTIFAALPAYYVWITPNAQEYLFLFFLGLGSNMIQFFVFKAYSYADVSALVPYRYADYIIAGLGGFLIFGEYPDKNAIIGALVIIPCTLYLFFAEKIHTKTAVRNT